MVTRAREREIAVGTLRVGLPNCRQKVVRPKIQSLDARNYCYNCFSIGKQTFGTIWYLLFGRSP